MTAAQKKALERLLPRVEQWDLRSDTPQPQLMNRLQEFGEFVRFHNSIGTKLTEFVISVDGAAVDAAD